MKEPNSDCESSDDEGNISEQMSDHNKLRKQLLLYTSNETSHSHLEHACLCVLSCLLCMYSMIQNFGKTVHTKNWWKIFWQMPKIAKAPKLINMLQPLPVRWNHIVLPWQVVKMKCFTTKAS